MAPKSNAPTLTAWIPIPVPCARCGLPIQVRCSKNFTRVAELLCTKCGWKFDLEPVRAAAKAQERQPEDIEDAPLPGELKPD
ncbi:hypothetical protein LCGC14_3167400 [marine sediment metagenome]|uniref:Uncharacterized protein n=1 Tax=marine sediment metagenome TaxID=412755 RepID=A0A0F8VIL4_9ZZZZ